MGLRPKLEEETDFGIGETLNSVHPLGVESPGLTASLALGDAVAERVVLVSWLSRNNFT